MDFLDFLSFVVFLAVFGFSVLILFPNFSMVFNSFSQDNAFSEPSRNIATEMKTTYIDYADYLFAALFFGLVLMLLGSVFIVSYHPVFLVFSIIIMLIVVWFSPILANAFIQFFNLQDEGIKAKFPIMSFVFQNLPLITLGVLMLFIFLAYTKGG